AREIAAAPAATTSAIAVGDVNLDGRLDLYLGNWYSAYGQSLGAHNNDLLLQRADGDGVTFVRQPLAEDAQAFSEEEDLAGRPTYGVMIAQLLQWAPHAKPERHEQGIVDHGDSAGAPE